MFATLLGSLPRPVGPDGAFLIDNEAAVRAAIAAQVEAGLDPLTDGRLRGGGFIGPFQGLPGVVGGPSGPRLVGLPGWREPLAVASWRFASMAVDGAGGLVKQALPGPYTLGRRLARGARGGDVDAVTRRCSLAVRSELLALADAGCAFVEVEERDAHLVGTDPVERARFARAHQELLDGVAGVHVSLAITGGNADTAGIETILAAPYPSLAVNLIDGPDNWRLVRATPGTTGIVCGAMATGAEEDEGAEILVWAAAYAASANGRGHDRVGLATAGSLEHLSWDVAVRKMRRLGRAARIAALPMSEAAEQLDPRALDIRSAAFGRYVKPEDRPRRVRRRR